MIYNKDSNIKAPVIIIIAGVFLFVIGTLVKVYFLSDNYENYIPQSPLLNKLINLSPILILCFPLIFAPIFEEIAFRSWCKSSKRWRIISLTGIGIYMYSIFNNVTLTFTATSILFLVYFKLNSFKILISAITTSLFFGIIHLNNFEIEKFTSIIQITGLGFLFSFIALKKGLIFSIIAHSMFNMISIFPLVMPHQSKSTILFENHSYKAKLIQLSIINNSNSIDHFGNDSIIISGHLTEIAEKLATFQHNKIYVPNINSLIKYKLMVKVNDSKRFNKKNLFTDYLNKLKLKIKSTVVQKGYTLELSTKNNQSVKHRTYKTSLYNFVEMIRKKYKIPLSINEGQKDSILYIPVSSIKIKNFDDFNTFISMTNGIKIHKNKNISVEYLQILKSP